jgi:5-methylcytosine-specific restriction protein A
MNIGQNRRQEFSQKTRKAAWERADGTCECGCERPFDLNHPLGCPDYHHRIEAISGGDNSLDNCMCIRRDCHKAITATESAPKAAKIRREDKRKLGFEAQKRTIPGSKASGWKAKVGGGWERREK